MKEPVLQIIIENARWSRITGLRGKLQRAAGVTLASLPKSMRFPVSANLLLTSDAAIQRLNRDFRGLDKPTNVLSFPQFTPRQLSKMGKSRGGVEVGDVVMASQYVVAEAKKYHKILINHVIHLLIHGLLHLFGYDHLSDKDAGKMERLEKRIMAELGLPDPYKVPVLKAPRPKPKRRHARKQRT